MNNITITQVLQQTDTGAALLIMEALPLYPAPHLMLWCVT